MQYVLGNLWLYLVWMFDYNVIRVRLTHQAPVSLSECQSGIYAVAPHNGDMYHRIRIGITFKNINFIFAYLTFLSLLNRGSSPPTLLSAHSCCNSRAIIPPAPSSSSSSSASSPCCSAWTASNSATRLVDYRHGHSDRYPVSSYYSSIEVGHSACDDLILNI